ncbi:DNA-directed RNA polymerase III subunit RPC4 [Sesamum alatum]|uniref:DNA-directed RNA polymerase III subunit RPC4 n=1 Tax=Sesamum alatum TaxID=300844 RepID=A0AAE1YK13_9LAMI|nr:DNA-directed RNA polymerase III subunit RPC4 [Sesamum alatum]
MDSDPLKSTLRKVKFAPKAPPRRAPQPVTAKSETAAQDDSDDEQTQQFLSRKVNEHLARRGPKPEKKSSVQVAFSHGVAGTTIRTFGKPKERTEDRADAADSNGSPISNGQNIVTSISTAVTEGVDQNVASSTDAVVVKKKREYKEPWDYKHSCYPTTLPWRRPYSGNPEELDKIEFEEAPEYDENDLSSASDLGLLGQDDTHRMLFFQFPPNLPLGRRQTDTNKRETANDLKALESGGFSAASKGKEIVGNGPRVSGISTGSIGGHPSSKGCSLEELPEGCMGKMLVYKSGAVKLKLGDILYDVSPGSDCTFAQSVMAIDTTNRDCCDLGALNKRAVVTPDIDFLVDNVIDLG